MPDDDKLAVLATLALSSQMAAAGKSEESEL